MYGVTACQSERLISSDPRDGAILKRPERRGSCCLEAKPLEGCERTEREADVGDPAVLANQG